MYNNEVTYDKKFETLENLKALEELKSKYFDRSICQPSCPTGWAPEVLELLNTIDKELGIKLNTQTIKGYHLEGNPLQWFILRPFKEAYRGFYHRFLQAHDKESRSYKNNIEGKSKFELLLQVATVAMRPIVYGFKVIKVKYVNKYLNNLLKPKLTLSQIKEKCGHLTLYFSCPDVYEEYVNVLVRKTQIKLALKGCYYPLETLYNSSVSYNVDNEYEPDNISVKKYTDKDGKILTTVTKTTYRNLMQDLGINLEEVKVKAALLKKKKRKK